MKDTITEKIAEDFKSRIKKSGAIAFIAGAARKSCPLAKGSVAREAWLRGYDAAKRAAG